jgi:hypothetical protein
MAERGEFLFEIDIPARRLPMARLAEYVKDLAIMLGQEDHVHLVEIRESSTVLVPFVDAIAFQKVQKQVLAVRNRSAPQKAMTTYETINNRLADDSASAVLRGAYGTVVQFPGNSNKPVTEDLGPVIEPDSIDGEIIQIGGRDETISVYIRDKHETPVICTTTRDKGRSLAQLIFQQVRVNGQATWIRANNKWKRTQFSIDSWSELTERSLESTIQQLRDVPTPNIDKIDPFAILADIRGHGGRT